MHDGSFSTLEEVIEHYNSGGKSHRNKSSILRQLNLSIQDKQDLVAFLKALTDEK
jgi:cytochrome c peroxidase